MASQSIERRTQSTSSLLILHVRGCVGDLLVLDILFAIWGVSLTFVGLIPFRQRIELVVKFQYVLMLLASALWYLSEFIPFEGWLTSHYMHMPHWIYLFVTFGHWGCFQLLANINNSALSVGVGCFWGYLISWHFDSVSWRGRLLPKVQKSPQAGMLLVAVGSLLGPLKCSLQRRDCSLCSQAPDSVNGGAGIWILYSWPQRPCFNYSTPN